jgi:GT2 family glycosyltransferase
MNHQNKSQNPKISVLLVDGSYRPHFAVIDSLKRQTFAANDYEVLWIEYYDKVKQELIEKMNARENFRVITLKENGIYHSSYCFNRGIMDAQGEILVILDADVLFGEDFLEKVWDEHQNNECLVMYVFRMDEPEQPGNSPFCLDLDSLKKKCQLANPSNYGGCLTVRKKWLLKINGYEKDDVFRTGGDHANGLDVHTRFKNLGMHIMWSPDLRIYHPWHPHKPGRQKAYMLQRLLIEHRAKNLDVFPYKGIDPALDRDIPEQLQAQLDAERNKT